MSDETNKPTEETKENIKDDVKEEKQEEQKNPSVQEKEQEAKLRAKYPGLRGPGSNAFLQKRLSKGQKYFDSGDYNMAKAKMGGGAASKPLPQSQKLLLPGSTGDTIPTPEAAHRKPSLIPSGLAGGLSS